MIEQFLRIWLQNLARQRLQAAARDALRRGAVDQARRALDQAHAAQDPSTADPPEADQQPRCHVGLVFALGMEAGGLEDRLNGNLALKSEGLKGVQGGLRGRGVVLAISGAGQPAALRAAENLIQGHRPDWVISAGYAGGLRPGVARFDVVVADSVVTRDENRPAVLIDLPAPPDGEKGVHVGRLLTVERVITDPAEKRSLGERYGAVAVEMETAGVAELCRDRGVPFLAVRVITDAVDDALPRDVDRLLKEKSTAGQLGAALGALIRRPSSALDLYQLKENALIATDRLAKFLEPLIVAITDSPEKSGGE